jgi:hypothetical protein
MSNTHCRFCEVTIKGIYLNCPKCGRYLVPNSRGKRIAPEPYELADTKLTDVVAIDPANNTDLSNPQKNNITQ